MRSDYALFTIVIGICVIVVCMPTISYVSANSIAFPLLYLNFYFAYLCQDTNLNSIVFFSSFISNGGKPGSCFSGASVDQYYQFAWYCAGNTYSKDVNGYVSPPAIPEYVKSTFDNMIQLAKSYPASVDSYLGSPNTLSGLRQIGDYSAQLANFQLFKPLGSTVYVPSADKASIISGIAGGQPASAASISAGIFSGLFNATSIQFKVGAFAVNARIKLTGGLNLLGRVGESIAVQLRKAFGGSAIGVALDTIEFSAIGSFEPLTLPSFAGELVSSAELYTITESMSGAPVTSDSVSEIMESFAMNPEYPYSICA